MIRTGESCKEGSARKRSLANPKKKVRVGCWNVRTLYSTGRTAQVMKEMRRYKIGILGISECRWSGFGRLKTQPEEKSHSGRDDKVHQSGVALALDKESAKCLECWAPISDRIISARFYSRYIKTSIIQVYAPTNEAEVEAKDDCYDQLQKVIDSVPKHDILVLMGDWNAKVGERQVGEERVMGKEALKCVRNDNGEQFVEFCATNNLVITTT